MSLSPFTAEALLRVANIVEAVPDKKFDLDYWYSPKSDNGCGTTFCAMGHAACDPWFKEHGLHLDKRWHEIVFRTEDGDQLESFEAVASFLNIKENDAWYMFYTDSYDEIPTKELVVARIRNFVATDGVPYAIPTSEQRERLQRMMAELDGKEKIESSDAQANELMRQLLAKAGAGLVKSREPEATES